MSADKIEDDWMTTPTTWFYPPMNSTDEVTSDFEAEFPVLLPWPGYTEDNDLSSIQTGRLSYILLHHFNEI